MKINVQYAEGLPRPDFSWAEALLGERLQMLSKGLLYRPSATAHLDASWIPSGSYCYHLWPYRAGARPCPYFDQTDHGTTTCAFMQVEAYDDGLTDWVNSPIAKHFGGQHAAEKQGVVDRYDLPDALKICGVNEQEPTFLQDHLLPDVAFYEAVLAGLTDVELVRKKGRSVAQLRLLGTAWSRFRLWETLCAMTGPVPPEVIHRVVKADEQFRAATQTSEERMHDITPDDLLLYPNPKQQFWYFYRCNPPESWKVWPVGFSTSWEWPA